MRTIRRTNRSSAGTCGVTSMLAVGGLLLSNGCASSSYMGISLAPGETDPAVQELAVRARSSDKQAQFDLGKRFETGEGLPHDPRRAVKLYRQTPNSRAGTQMIYVPVNGHVEARSVYIGSKEKVLQSLRELNILHPKKEAICRLIGKIEDMNLVDDVGVCEKSSYNICNAYQIKLTSVEYNNCKIDQKSRILAYEYFDGDGNRFSNFRPLGLSTGDNIVEIGVKPEGNGRDFFLISVHSGR